MVDMALVKELRNRTQAKLNDCRKAILESNGDLDTAVGYLMKKGLADSVKRSGAVATEGVVLAGAETTTGALVEVNVQTDFAARNPEFLQFAEKVLVAALEDKLTIPLSGELEEERVALGARLGENLTVSRSQEVVLSDGAVVAYNHPGGKIAALVRAGQFSNVLQDVAMQVAAMNPQYTRPSGIPTLALEAQEGIFRGQLKEDGKVPEDKWDRVVEGKMQKWFKEVCLLNQMSVIESKKTVDQVLRESGVDTQLVEFTRFERGEMAQPEEKGDFASEVAAMVSN